MVTENLNRRKMLLLVGSGLTLVILIIAIVWFASLPTSETTNDSNEEATGIEGDPTDIAFDFYDLWLTSRLSSTSVAAKDPLEFPGLSAELRNRLSQFDRSPTNTELDPVVCQTTPSDNLRTRTIYELENEMQQLVLTEDSLEGRQAVVTLKRAEELWQITSIDCSLAEQAPDTGEFSFDNTGQLLKDSLPENFDKQYWYIVYSQDDLKGLTAPLILGSESTCINLDGAETTCSPESFFEAMPVKVQGQMSELGVEVHRIEKVTFD